MLGALSLYKRHLLLRSLQRGSVIQRFHGTIFRTKPIFMQLCQLNLQLKKGAVDSLVPRLSPSSLFYMRDFIYAKLLWEEEREGRGRAWEALITCGH